MAFHPSGLHLIVALQDKVWMLNILGRSLQAYKQLTVKGCHEIRFAHGGHLFALAREQNIYVYNFYTGDQPSIYAYEGAHTQVVRSINWFENDMTFSSTGLDGNIYFFDLMGEPGKRNQEKYEGRKDVKFTCLANLPNKPYEFIAVGNEKTIFTTSESIMAKVKTVNDMNPQARLPEIQHHLSQLAVHHSGKSFFAGVGDANQSYPGSIQIWKLPFERINEI